MKDQYQRIRFPGSNCELSALDYANPGKPDLVVVHGMRDHALSMGSIVDTFLKDFHVVVPDLRGHGDSDNPGSYAMVQFIADLRALIDHCDLENPVLVGHSLGGHITAKYAATFPNSVAKLALIDGMGPPRPPVEPTRESLQATWQSNVDRALHISSERRAMKDADEALSRLTRNNPKLARSTAKVIVENGIEPHPGGGVCWKWDPAVDMVWTTFDHAQSELQWSFIDCPVLIVTGEDSMSYWSRRGLAADDLSTLHARETERRRLLFRDAIHVEIPGAGHMIHYDEPEALSEHLWRFVAG